MSHLSLWVGDVHRVDVVIAPEVDEHQVNSLRKHLHLTPRNLNERRRRRRRRK
jgi:hypothetical protein